MSLFPQLLLPVLGKIAVDLFAGGGGASVGYEMATGRHVDVAINHDPRAVEMHKANHPTTLHLVTDVFEVDPRLVCDGREVGMLWASPDCTHHSKARGGKPIRTGRRRRALAWVVTRWAGTVRPDVIFLENVEEFAQWGPLVGKPTELRPCPKRKGQTFRRWVASLTRLGYVVEWRELRAFAYGAPTIRKRLYLIARRDGQPIVWPDATHGDPATEDVRKGRLLPWRTAAECIDWSIPMASIFLTKEEARAWGKAHGQNAPIRPLALNTERRIARAVKRYVLDSPRPFLVTIAHGEGAGDGRRWGAGVVDLDGPLSTAMTKNQHAVAAPVVANVANGQTTGRAPNAWSVEEPLRTATSANGFGLAAPVMVKNNHGDKPFSGPSDPLATIVAGGTHHMVAAPVLTARYGERDGQAPRCRSVAEPLPTVVNDGNGASLAVAGLSTYYGGPGGETRGVNPEEPLRTQGTENRFSVWAAALGQNNGGFYEGPGRSLSEPVATILSNSRGHFPMYGIGLTKARGTSVDADPLEPLDTISAGGLHHGVAAACLAPYYRTDQAGRLDSPLPTQTAVDRHALAAAAIVRDFGQSVGGPVDVPVGALTGGGGGKAALAAAMMMRHHGPVEGRVSLVQMGSDGRVHPDASVVVRIRGGVRTRHGTLWLDVEPGLYRLVDVLMRMLQPRELYLAQGFPPSYVIDRGADGRELTKTEQVRMVGNSVCPPVACALIRANVPEMVVRELPKPSRREAARRAA